nr:hypothetical protein [Pantoea stewartii]
MQQQTTGEMLKSERN